MFNLKSIHTQQATSNKEPPYLPKDSVTPEKKLIYTKGTASPVMHTWMPQERTISGYSLYSKDPYYGIANVIPEMSVISQIYGDIASANPSTIKPKPIPSDEIVIVPLRELPRDDAKKEIAEYIRRAGGRKVYISELAEELRLDIELIMEIMEELEAETQK